MHEVLRYIITEKGLCKISNLFVYCLNEGSVVAVYVVAYGPKDDHTISTVILWDYVDDG